MKGNFVDRFMNWTLGQQEADWIELGEHASAALFLENGRESWDREHWIMLRALKAQRIRKAQRRAERVAT